MATSTTPKKTTTKSTAKPRTAAKKPAASVEKTVQAAAKANQQAAETAVKAGAEAVTENIEKVMGSAKERFEESVERMKSYSAINRENLDAVVASGTVMQKGLQAVNAEIAAISRRNMEDSVAAIKSLTGAKSPTELFELQSDLMRSSWDNMLADGNRISEMMSEYTKDAMEPINTQVKKAVEQMSQPFAA